MPPVAIILFDIIAKEPSHRPWSPNTWKARYTLNLKNLPYRTEWVEYPDIEALCTKYNVAPTSKKKDGRPHYTLPMIYDPSTKTAVTDSVQIAKYPDKTYPDTPKLFPEEVKTDALQMAFLDVVGTQVGDPLFMTIITRTCHVLTPRSAEYFRRTREAMFGKPLEELGGEEDWKELEIALGKVDGWLRANGQGKDVLLLGDRVCFADLQLAAYLNWARIVCGKDSDDWKRISEWHDGKWKRLVEYFDKYAAVDLH